MKTYTKECVQCGKTFKTGLNYRKYCSKKCQRNFHKIRLRGYCKEMRDLSRELGNCTRCHLPKENPKYYWCLECRKIARMGARRRRK